MLLWNSIDEWSKAVDVWHEQPFHTLNVSEIVNINEKILNNCQLLTRHLPSNKIVPKLGADAELMKCQLPAIMHLRNPALKPSHWTNIETIIKRNGLQNDSVTLCVFEEANVFDADITIQIIEISKQASIERELEALLQSVDNSWKEFELTFLPYRESKELFILTGIESLRRNLDDSMMKVNTIASSDYIDHIHDQIDEWIGLLNLFESTMDAWCTCQSYYIQFETIFAVVDMQRNLPIETEMFAKLDENWKSIMIAAHKSPHALQCMTNRETNKELCCILNGMEIIRKRFEHYLDVKRHAFPRLFPGFFYDIF